MTATQTFLQHPILRWLSTYNGWGKSWNLGCGCLQSLKG